MKLRSKNKGLGMGMGFLLVFFPEEPNKSPNFNHVSSSNLLHRAQSTISICLFLLFLTLLLFTLSTLPSSTTSSSSRRHLLLQNHQFSNFSHSYALQRMGTLYRRGTKPMNDVVVAHVPESLTPNDLKLFLRLFYRSTLASRSDLVFVFPNKLPDFDELILRENHLFGKLLEQYGQNFRIGNNNSESAHGSFEVSHFLKKSSNETAEPIWGRRSKSNSTEEGDSESQSSTRASYGSVVSFDADELDPGNSLSGFLDHAPPMSLRRWACYPMLLGRLKRNFKHVMLIDAKEMLVLGDPLGRARSLGPDSVLSVTTQSSSGKHGRRAGAIHPRPKAVHPGVLMGGSRGIRRLSNEMVTAIVRASMQQRKKKKAVTEWGVVNQVVGNEFVLKKVNVVAASESESESEVVVELSSVSGKLELRNYSVVRRGNGNGNGNENFDYTNNLVTKYLCSFAIEVRVYSDC